MMSDSDECQCCESTSDTAVCVGVALMLLGCLALAVAYVFPYDGSHQTAYDSARQAESAELRAWTVFTVSWTLGLSLIALSFIIISSTIVYDNIRCGLVMTRSHGDVMPLSGGPAWTGYGTSDCTELTRGHE